MSNYDFELNLNNRNSLSILISRIKPNSLILEFGPANGRMTKYMKEELNCRVYAIELDEKAAKDASLYTEKIIVDGIENNNWQNEFRNIKFDYIIFADVLEHLYYPEKVLEDAREFLKKDGSILISIPNIAHNSIIINLLKNEFNYGPIGLLDNTHIRFYTKKTFDELIHKINYFISYETATFINPESTEFLNSYDELKPEIAKYLKECYYGESYQLIYEIKKNKCETISDFKEEYKEYKKDFIQLFIDDLDGVREDNSIKLPVINNNKIQRFEFSLKDKKNIKSLRIDPLDKCVVLKIHKIKINDDIYQKQIISNAVFIYDGVYYFNTNDSQIYIDVEDYNHILDISFDLEYVSFEEDTMKELANILLKLLAKKEQNINSLNQELEKKEQILEKQNQELNNIYNSKRWRILSIFRGKNENKKNC